MSVSRAASAPKYMAGDSQQASGLGSGLSRQMKSDIVRLGIIAVFIFLGGFIFHIGNWLDVALTYKAYHVDDIIMSVFVVSFALMAFLIRGWRKLRQEGRRRALLGMQIAQRAAINEQLSQMTGLLHACFVLEEACSIIALFARQLFPDHAGALYVFRSSRNLLEVSVTWGETEDQEPMIMPQQCWALRQGQMYTVQHLHSSILCQHVHHTHPYICLPMMAHGEVLALLHVYPLHGITADESFSDEHRALLRNFTEHIALALSNLKLRETLRQQSIRDPLTGLFNRRYLEEAITIEVERAKRNNAPFSVMMLDLDHFKRFNDTHGHDAGDAVLQALGGFLQRQVRGGDIACRYGGEEFTLILPGTSLQVAQQRAEQLCEGVRSLAVDFKDQLLGPLTLSVGIATFPQHGMSGEIVLQAADVALYRAKREGRDRAVAAAAI